MEVTPEDWEAWRGNPVTQWVMKALHTASEAQKAAWLAASWDKGDCSPLALVELKTRADAYSALSEVSREDLEAMHDSTR